MRLTVKSLDGKQFAIEVELSTMVEDLKATIAKNKAEMVVDRQKLVYQGKILADGKPLSAYGVAENSFVVCMLVKPSAEQRAAAEAAEEAAAAEEEEDEEEDEVSIGGEAEEEGFEQMVLDQSVVDQLVTAMGFPEDQVRAALNAAYGDPDLAVEYLMTGIPEGQGEGGMTEGDEAMTAAEMQQMQSMLQQAVANAGGGAPGAAAQAGAQAGAQAAPSGADLMSVDLLAGLTGAPPAQPQPPPPSPLAALRQHPQFDQLKALVQANPAMLTQVMQQIGSQSPEMIEAIQSNPDEFLAMLNEPIEPEP